MCCPLSPLRVLLSNVVVSAIVLEIDKIPACIGMPDHAIDLVIGKRRLTSGIKDPTEITHCIVGEVQKRRVIPIRWWSILLNSITIIDNSLATQCIVNNKVVVTIFII